MLKLNLKEKAFDGKIILSDLQIEIKNGEIFHIIGQSGIGKTTLMRILMGVDRDFEGEFENNFSSMAATYPERVFMGGISILNEIKIFTGKTREEIKSALEFLNMVDAKDKKASELSTGMRSRASIIRTMLKDADIVFLDEPLLGLDPKTKDLTIDFIKGHSRGKAIVYTGDQIFTNENRLCLQENN